MTLTPHFLPVGSIVEYNILIHNRWMPVRLNATDILQCETDNKHFNTFHRPLKLTPEILTEWCSSERVQFMKRHENSKGAMWTVFIDGIANLEIQLIEWLETKQFERCGKEIYLHQLQMLYSALTQTVLPITIK